MTFTPEVSSVNQQVQLGVEATPGTAVAANKLLKCFSWTIGVDPGVSDYTPSGNKYVATQEEDYEQTSVAVAGNLDYNGVPYLLASVGGIITPVAHGASSTAKDWISIPPLTGSVQAQTYSIEQGDAVRARKFNYCVLNSFGYKGTRKAPFTVSAAGFAQPITDGITRTASPTAVALAQVVEKQFSVYLDTTSAGLGTTILTRVLSVDYSFANVYGPFYALNRSTTGYTGYVDLMPKCSIKLLMEADAIGFAAMQGYLQSGQTVYLRVDAQGATIDAPNSVVDEFKHDLAIKVGKPTTFKDDQGIFAVEWECTVVQDPAWASGQAQVFTVTNLITAL